MSNFKVCRYTWQYDCKKAIKFDSLNKHVSIEMKHTTANIAETYEYSGGDYQANKVIPTHSSATQ